MGFDAELKEMVSKKNLMNSYKLFFLKAIIINASRQDGLFTFYQLACWMCALSFSNICELEYRIRPLDKLYDVIVSIISETELLESSTPDEIYAVLIGTKNEQLKKQIYALVN